MIPVGSGDLPINVDPLSESGVYLVTLDKVGLSPKPDRHGSVYCQLQTTVCEGDDEGYTLAMNYLPTPVYVDADATARERKKAARINFMFERFCRSFKITGKLPEVRLTDYESMEAFKNLMSQHIGNVGKVTAQNQEFPEGSGRVRSSIRDFIF